MAIIGRCVPYVSESGVTLEFEAAGVIRLKQARPVLDEDRKNELRDTIYAFLARVERLTEKEIEEVCRCAARDRSVISRRLKAARVTGGPRVTQAG